MLYAHNSIIKGEGKVIISTILLESSNVEKQKILYLSSIPSLKSYITSVKLYFENTNIKSILSIFLKGGNSITKYPVLNNSIVIDFTSDYGVDLTHILAGKSFKELIGVDMESEYFFGLEFLSSSEKEKDNSIRFILKYI